MTLASPGGDARADICKWVDEGGVTHYAAECPEGVDSRQVEIEPPPPSRPGDKQAASPEALSGSEQELPKNRNDRQQDRKRAKESAAEEERRCLETREQLAVLQEQLPVYRDEQGKFRPKWLHDTYQGERVYLDDDQRPAEIARVRKDIQAICPNANDAADQDLARLQMLRAEWCAYARAQLETIERPEAKSSQEAIDEQREKVELHCK
jgi:hypothetical protein